jgi:formylglycine-generating enzyme required for sulfatase activity
MSRVRNGHPLTGARAAAIAYGLLLCTGAARAEVGITNVTVTPRDARTAVVRFDIAWDNSWRHEANHDAAWVFFKVRADDKAAWQHVRLAADRILNPTGYGRGEGKPVDLIVPDGDDGFTGMFVRRAGYSPRGKVAASKVTAVWDLKASHGVKDVGKAQIRAFGIQMVYVAEGPFYLGSGGTEVNGFYKYTDGKQHNLPYRVTRAGVIPTGRQAGKLWARSSEPLYPKGAQPEDGSEIPAAFPNGFAAFYCMKYPITWSQYAGFLNTLTAGEANERYPYHASAMRQAPGVGRTDAITRSGEAPNFTYSTGSKWSSRRGYGGFGLSWADGVAFAAWAGLRPMTELELEKAVRGPRKPVPDETGPSYWGITPFAIGAWHSSKCGQFERAVTVGNAAGRRFAGTHGRGTTVLPADWPQGDAIGAGIRCSPFAIKRIGAPDPPHQATRDDLLDMPRACLSDRFYAAVAYPQRHPNHRWRGVRTAPKGVGP